MRKVAALDNPLSAAAAVRWLVHLRPTQSTMAQLLLLLPVGACWHTCPEDDHVSVLQVSYGPAPDVGLSHLPHLYGRLDTRRQAKVLNSSLGPAAAGRQAAQDGGGCVGGE